MRGIKYIGPCMDFSGYGEASRNYIFSLHEKGVPITVFPRNFDPNPPPIADEEKKEVLNSLIGKKIDYDVVIIHLTPDLYPMYAEKGKYNIGFSAWETSLIHPKWVHACTVLDEMWVPCFIRGTQVMTPSGYSNIEDISIDDFVYTHTGSVNTVSNVSCKKYTGTVYTVSSIEEVTCTPEHPFLTASLFFKQENRVKVLADSFISWKDAKDLVVGDYLCIPKVGFIEEPATLDVVNIMNNIGYNVVDNGSTCAIEYDQEVFNVKANKNISIKQKRCLKVPSFIDIGSKLARLLGYYLADGSQQSSKLHGINFVFGADEPQYVDDVVKCIESIFNVEPTISKRGNTKRVVVSSKVVSGLFKWLVVGKNKNKCLSNECLRLLLNSSLDVVTNFLVGYFNGDGYIEKNLRFISGFSVSKRLVEQVSLLSLKVGLLPSIKSDFRNESNLVVKGSAGYSWYYGGVQVETIRGYLSKYNNLEYAINRKRTQTFYSDDKYYYVPVKEITISEKENINVYNMEVSGDHSYVVNRTAVHNCDWNVEAFKNSGVGVPILKVPHGIDPNMFEGLEDKEFRIKDLPATTFKFYSIFQWIHRKNPDGLLRAYFNAFDNTDDVVLILKTYRAGISRDKTYIRDRVAEIKKDMNIGNYPRVILIGDILSKTQMLGLHMFGDCCVCLHRGEGWGLPLFEAGLAGNPVIATNCGGNTEFMNEHNSYLVDYQPTFVSNMSTFNPWYLGNQQWAEPNQVEAAKYMRAVFENKEEALTLGNRLSNSIKDNYSWSKVSELILERLTSIG